MLLWSRVDSLAFIVYFSFRWVREDGVGLIDLLDLVLVEFADIRVVLLDQF